MRQIANYMVEEEPLARGGMGQILKGYDPQGHAVAIKEILPEFATDFSIIARIDKEVEFLMKIDHPSIVNLYSAFRDPQNQYYYIVMELIDGLNVEQYVRQHGPIPYEEVKDIMVQVLSAMKKVHEAHIVHRDIKPSNIMICADKSVRLLDFGVAKDLDATNPLTTIPGSVIGTTGYMSPEQAAGYTVNWLSDIYSLGCVMYFMLTGHHAFNTLPSEFETKDAIINEEFPKLTKYIKGIPERYQRILDKATARNMMKRYMSCEEFANDIRGTVVPPTQSITLGRSQCDVVFDDTSCKISRHHADIELVVNTGNRHFVLTDHSANGTYVGNELVHHRSIHIPFDNPYVVRLAGVDAGLVDWDQVRRALADKVGDVIIPEGGSGLTDNGDVGSKGGVEIQGPNGDTPPPPPDIPEDAGEDGTGWLVAAWVFATLGGLIGILFGLKLATSKINYGNHRIYRYKKQHRQLGLAAACVSPISMLIWILSM